MALDRRDFLKAAGAQTGFLIAGSGSLGATIVPSPRPMPAPAVSAGLPDVVVIGAGCIGGWTALHLQALGAKVMVVDAYGPGNSRSTSGDFTRGVRSSYGDRPHGEQWMQWAFQAMQKWKEWDETFWRDLGCRIYFTSGDLITRPDWEPFLTQTREWWVKNNIPHETLSVDEARYRWPVFDLRGINAVLYEPGAGVVRARRSVECVASMFQKRGGEIHIERVSTLMRGTGMIDELVTANGTSIRGGQYVFACGPWLPKVFSHLLAPRMRTPMGNVFYMATPIGDQRFQAPYMPSHNFPGVVRLAGAFRGQPWLSHPHWRRAVGGSRHQRPDGGRLQRRPAPHLSRRAFPVAQRCADQ